MGLVEPAITHLAPTFLNFPGRQTPGFVPLPEHLGARVHTFTGLSQISPLCFHLHLWLQQVRGSPKLPLPGSHCSLGSRILFPQRVVPVPDKDGDKEDVFELDPVPD